MTLVVTDSHAGVMRRFVCAEGKKRLTHEYVNDSQPCTFTPEVVEEMRLLPPDAYSVEPPPRPTLPPSNSGFVPIAMAA